MWRFNMVVENKFALSYVLLPTEITPVRIVPKAPQRQLNSWYCTRAQISNGFKLKVCNVPKKERVRLERSENVRISENSSSVPNKTSYFCDLLWFLLIFGYVYLHSLLLHLCSSTVLPLEHCSIVPFLVQLDTQFLHKIKRLYMFRASSAHPQEVNVVNP